MSGLIRETKQRNDPKQDYTGNIIDVQATPVIPDLAPTDVPSTPTPAPALTSTPTATIPDIPRTLRQSFLDQGTDLDLLTTQQESFYTQDYDEDASDLLVSPPGLPALDNADLMREDLARIERQRQETLNFSPTEIQPYNFQFDNSLADRLREGGLLDAKQVENKNLKITTQAGSNPIQDGTVDGVLKNSTVNWNPLGGYKDWAKQVKENPLNILKLPFVIYSNENEYGDYGKGLFGATMWAIDTVENTVSGAANDVNDLVTGDKSVKQIIQNPRPIQALRGKDYSIFNRKSEDVPLGFIGSNVAPGTYGEYGDRSVASNIFGRVIGNTPAGVLIEQGLRQLGVIEGGTGGGLLNELTELFVPDSDKRKELREETVINLPEWSGTALQVGEGAAAFGLLLKSPIITGFGVVSKGLDAVGAIGKKVTRAIDKTEDATDLLKFSDEVETVRRTDSDLIRAAKANGDVNPGTPDELVNVDRLLEGGYERYGARIPEGIAPDAIASNVPEGLTPAQSYVNGLVEALKQGDVLDLAADSARDLDLNVNLLSDPSKYYFKLPEVRSSVATLLPESLRGRSDGWAGAAQYYFKSQNEFNKTALELSEIDLKWNKSLADIQELTEVYDPLPQLGRRPVTKAASEMQRQLPTEILPPTKKAIAINGKQWYHGTQFDDVVDLRSIDPIEGSARHELGTGIYLTDDPRKAATYAKALPHDNIPNLGERQLSGYGRVLEVRTNISRPLDANQPLPDEILQTAIEATGNNQIVLDNLKGIPYNQLYDRLPNLTEDVMLEFQRNVSANLRLSGTDAIADGDTLVLLGHAADNKIDEVVEVANGAIKGDIEQATARINANSLLRNKYPDSKFAEVTQKESRLELAIRHNRQLKKFKDAVTTEARKAGQQLADATRKLEDASKRDSDAAYAEIQKAFNGDSSKLVDGGRNPVRMSQKSRWNLEATNRVAKSRQLYESAQANKISQQATANTAIDNSFKNNIGKLEYLMPGNIKRVSAFLTNRLGLKQKMGGLSSDLKEFSKAGEMRNAMVQTSREARALVNLAIKEKAAPALDEMIDAIEGIVKSENIVALKNNRDALDRFTIRTIEAGSIPSNNVGLGLHAAGRAYNLRRYEQWVQQARALGISDASIADLVRQSSKVGAAMDEVRALAVASGADIGDVEGLGYFSRIMLPNAKRIIQSKVLKSEGIKAGKEKEAVGSVKAIHDKGRKTYEYVAESVEHLADKLGVSVDEIGDAIEDGKLLVSKLDGLEESQLDHLVDTGLLSRVPMFTDDVANYLISKYELPMSQLNEVFETNPRRALDLYKDSIGSAASKNVVGKALVDEGYGKGWMIGEETYKQLGDKVSAADWVKLDTNVIRKIYPAYTGEGVRYVQKPVWGMIQSVADLSTSASDLSQMGQLFTFWNRFITQSLITSAQFPMRIIYSNVIQLKAAGGDLYRMPGSVSDVIRYAKNGFEALDNSKAIHKVDGEMLSDREAFRLLLSKIPENLAPDTSVTLGTTKNRLKNPIIGAKRGARYLINYGKEFGLTASGAMAGEMASRAQGNILSYFANVANLDEVASKWALFKSLSAKGKSLDEIVRTINEYYFMADDAGSLVKKAGKVFPFASYLFNNPPQQIRNVMRHPKQFVNYMRLRSLINSRAASDETLTDAGTPDYILDSAPIYLFKDGDEWVSLLTRSYDPIMDGLLTVKEMLGGANTTLKKQEAKMNKGKQGALDFFQKLFQKSHPGFQTIVNALTGRDEFGRDLEEINSEPFLGMRMPAAMRMVLETYAPLSQLNRFNPGDIFGSPQITDPRTGEVIREGTTSFAGEYRKDNSQFSKYSGGAKQWLVRIAGIGGFNVKVGNVARDTQWTYRRMKSNLQETKRELTKHKKEVITKNGDRDEYKDLVGRVYQFELELLMLEAHMKKHGIPENEILGDVLNNALKGVSPISEEERNAIMKEYLDEYLVEVE